MKVEEWSIQNGRKKRLKAMSNRYVTLNFFGKMEVIDVESLNIICATNHKQNAELIAKILNDDENGISSVYKA